MSNPHASSPSHHRTEAQPNQARGLSARELQSLRHFLQALATGARPEAIPDVLTRLARAAVRGTPIDDDAGAADARAALLLKLTQLARRKGLEPLLARSDAGFVASLRTALRRAARDLDPLLQERHSLAGHVRRALAEPGSQESCAPLSLTDVHGRFVYASVRAAVGASALRQLRSASALTSRLLGDYVARTVDERALAECEAPPSVEPTGLERVRLRALLDGVVAELGSTRAGRLGRSLEGASLTAISGDCGVPRSTLHVQLRRDNLRLRALSRRAGGLDAAGAGWLVASLCAVDELAVAA